MSEFESPSPEATTAPGQSRAERSRHLLTSRVTGWVVASVLACAVVGLSVALATTSSTPTGFQTGVATPFRNGATPPGRFGNGPGPFGGGFGMGTGAAIGTVDTVAASSFTMTTATGQKLTVDEQSSTTYRKGTSSASGSAVTHGAHVFVRGSESGSTIKATQITVLPAGSTFNFRNVTAAS
jgi:hypothetical protein